MRAFTHEACLTLLAGFAMTSVSAPDAFAGPSFTLVQDGAGQATIEVAEQPCPAAKLAARELQYFVEPERCVACEIVSPKSLVFTGENRILGARQ